ncbi:MAG: bifunctional glutamate N-acetyltransferase/amino-acid acetyltransferase ArgJ [Actinobacteria bacterium]|nr:bifunctional glutamate N-acetyltransferase/amino-acid acetyltransferase ArgJ [Actinomycetota bacterium]
MSEKFKKALPQGFRAAGIAVGIKSSGKKDLALIVNDGPELFGTAVFTSNQVVAAPVMWSHQVIRDQQVKAVLLNSGGANACTGPDGFADTHRSAELVAEHLSISSSDVGICSTGLIGIRLPMEKIEVGIPLAIASLSSEGIVEAAEAIMTTDSKPKISTTTVNGVTCTGIAKGAGMLAPSLATMLSVIMIDGKVSTLEAIEIFADVCNRTFNRIDSDGCTSTNDTIFFLASGASGVTMEAAALREILMQVCGDLAEQLIADAEGHTKVVSITTVNARSERDAVEIGRACARNNLLKCALNGEDPNWGRVLAALGTTNAIMDPTTIDVSLNGVMVCKDSAPGEARELVDLSGTKIEILIDMKIGNSNATILTNDLSAMYVHENSAYAT